MDLQTQISNAVTAAITPGPQQGEGYRYLEGVKAESDKTWQACLDIFFAGSFGNESGQVWSYTYGPEARMYGLQVVDDALQTRFDTINSSQVLILQAGLLDYVQREYIQGEGEGQLFYLRNKVVHTLFLLFMQTYTSTWSNFFSSFISLLPSSNSSTEPFNGKTTDLLLRLLHEISVEIADTTLRLNKAHVRLTRDMELRDAIRERDAPTIADQVVQILAYTIERIGQPSSQLSSLKAVELTAMAVGVLADYSSWIDVSLVVTTSFLPLLFRCLSMPHLSVRLASADLLYELVTKGMPPSDKLELLRVLDISEAIKQLLDVDDARKGISINGNTNGASVDAAGHDEGSELFREKLARVLGGMGLELTKIVDEASATDAQKQAAQSAALAQRAIALRFLADEYDDTSATVIPFLQSIMSIYKKEKKRSPSTHLTREKADFLDNLLNTTIGKMRYASEVEWMGDGDDDGDDDDAVAFAEMRKNLKTLFDAVAWIDFDLFSTSVKSLILQTLDSVDSGRQALAWKDVEVAVYVLYLFGEPATKEKGTTAAASFLQISAEHLKKTKTSPDYRLDYNNYPPSVLGELLLRTIQSNVSSWPHPSVPLQLFECVSRYHDFFNLVPHTITNILPAFLDERGMHQARQSIRSRCFYLFNRFVHTARIQLQQHMTPEAVTDMCTRVEDLLVIQATIPAIETPGEDILARAASRGSPFDSQLYLFDALGTLISLLSDTPEQQVGLLRALLEPLLRDIQTAGTTSGEDLEVLLRLHHLIKAVGSVAYGFPELKNTTVTPGGQWVLAFQEAMRVILASLKVHNRIPIIREASLGAFKSVAARIGEAALPQVAPLIDCLVDQLMASELVEFLPFIGMLTHRYKSAFADMLDLLLEPVFDRTYFFLEQPITGTDDIQQHSELRRAYFNVLLSISNANMQDVFLSIRNAPRLENLLNSIPHYLSNGALLLDQRVGFSVIVKLLTAWIKPVQDKDNEESALPRFKDFVYERIVRLGLELPVRQAFDYGDAQAYQVIGEIALLYKVLQSLRGQEFLDYLSTTIFPSFGVPQETVQSFLTSLVQASDGRDFKKYLAPFFKKAKQTSHDKPYSVAHLLTVVPGAS